MIAENDDDDAVVERGTKKVEIAAKPSYAILKGNKEMVRFALRGATTTAGHEDEDEDEDGGGRRERMMEGGDKLVDILLFGFAKKRKRRVEFQGTFSP